MEAVGRNAVAVAICLAQHGGEREVVAGEVGIGEHHLAVERRDLVRVEPELRAFRPILVDGGQRIFVAPATARLRVGIGLADTGVECPIDVADGPEHDMGELVQEDVLAIVATGR